jgi:hypothetical protein
LEVACRRANYTKEAAGGSSPSNNKKVSARLRKKGDTEQIRLDGSKKLELKNG